MNLDDALAGWAVTVRMSDADADGVFQRIVATPVPEHPAAGGLDAAWWRQYTGDFTARMVASMRPVAWTA